MALLHKSIPSPDPVACPYSTPHNSISLPTSSQCRIPMVCPHKSIPSPGSSHAPPWRVLINQCHHPVPASVAHPHKLIPSPRSSQCREPPSNKPIAPIQPGSRPHGAPYESIPSPQSSQCRMPPWINPYSILSNGRWRYAERPGQMIYRKPRKRVHAWIKGWFIVILWKTWLLICITVMQTVQRT